MTSESVPASGVWYLAKFALTDGIREIDASSGWSIFKDKYLSSFGRNGGFFRIGRDVFNERSDAVSTAESMRAKKVASLQKQLQRIEGLKFE